MRPLNATATSLTKTASQTAMHASLVQLSANALELFGVCRPTHKLAIPLFISKVPAGFPSPSDDYIEQHLDLNEYLIKHPAATFMVRVSGHSMVDAGIHPNDILIVDRSLEPMPGKVVIAAVNGEFTVKRLQQNKAGQWLLSPANKQYPTIVVDPLQEVTIWGVVAHVIHAL